MQQSCTSTVGQSCSIHVFSRMRAWCYHWLTMNTTSQQRWACIICRYSTSSVVSVDLHTKLHSSPMRTLQASITGSRSVPRDTRQFGENAFKVGTFFSFKNKCQANIHPVYAINRLNLSCTNMGGCLWQKFQSPQTWRRHTWQCFSFYLSVDR